MIDGDSNYNDACNSSDKKTTYKTAPQCVTDPFSLTFL